MEVEQANIIGIVENEFTESVRQLLITKTGSFELCNWAWSCIENNSNTNNLKELVAILINEHHALHKQLNRMNIHA